MYGNSMGNPIPKIFSKKTRYFRCAPSVEHPYMAFPRCISLVLTCPLMHQRNRRCFFLFTPYWWREVLHDSYPSYPCQCRLVGRGTTPTVSAASRQKSYDPSDAHSHFTRRCKTAWSGVRTWFKTRHEVILPKSSLVAHQSREANVTS